MTNSTLDWNQFLSSDVPPTASLRKALFTTYDRPDRQLFTEQLLRALLRVDHDPAAEGRARECFLVEISRRLAELDVKPVVISSTVREEGGETPGTYADAYPWLNTHVEFLTVGRTGSAIQHAKLWLFHWADTQENTEYVEVVISSMNLTQAAFSGQIQAGWRVVLPLEAATSKARLGSWGVLAPFLTELFNSANAPESLSAFLDLLSRAECPAGVRFVASVPGRHSRAALRKTPWGSAGLAAVLPAGQAPPSICISSPFVGEWDSGSLSHWAEQAQSRPDRLSLAWIDRDHLWSAPGRWALARSTCEAFFKAGVRLLHLADHGEHGSGSGRLHEEQASTDPRWSHAKLYAFQRGSSRRLLITSANFSTSAWGRLDTSGNLHIRNFELGVCLEQIASPFTAIRKVLAHDRVAVVDRLVPQVSGLIEWAEAKWDGHQVRLTCRCTGEFDVLAVVRGQSQQQERSLALRASGGTLSGVLDWPADHGYPFEARFACEGQDVLVPVQDTRDRDADVLFLPSELDQADAEALHYDLLLEKYGGRVVDELEGALGALFKPSAAIESSETTEESGERGSGDSYSVAAFEIARQHLSVVDGWQSRVTVATAKKNMAFALRGLMRDGEHLVVAFEKRVLRDASRDPALAIGAQLAAAELRIRLKTLSAQ
jgi:hypothetical protein